MQKLIDISEIKKKVIAYNHEKKLKQLRVSMDDIPLLEREKTLFKSIQMPSFNEKQFDLNRQFTNEHLVYKKTGPYSGRNPVKRIIWDIRRSGPSDRWEQQFQFNTACTTCMNETANFLESTHSDLNKIYDSALEMEMQLKAEKKILAEITRQIEKIEK